MSDKKYQGIKITKEFYNKLTDLRVILIRKGIGNLPKEVNSGIENYSLGSIIKICVRSVKYLLNEDKLK